MGFRMKPSSERLQSLKAIGQRVLAARTARQLSIPELSAQTGISQQHLRRLEDGENEPGALSLQKIARTLNCTLDALVPHLPSVQENVEALWRQYRLGVRLPGAEKMPLEARRQLLESMELWKEGGAVPILPNREALNDVIMNLPDNTTFVGHMGISLQTTLGRSDQVRRKLANILRAGGDVRLLMLSGESSHVGTRAAQDTTRTAEKLRGRISDGLTEALDIIAAAGGDPVRHVRSYDQYAIWRLLLLRDRVYVSQYPLIGDGSRSPVSMYERDPEGRSLYWGFFQVFHSIWEAAGPNPREGAALVAALVASLKVENEKRPSSARRQASPVTPPRKRTR
jgi:transcriptional regulator with XRE-family HTH domain